jgi:hypothetical protein
MKRIKCICGWVLLLTLVVLDDPVMATTGGTSWSAVNNGLPTASVVFLMIDPTNSENVYAGVNNGYGIAADVFKSTNGGTSWSAFNNGLTDSNGITLYVTSLAIDPTNNQNVYVGAYGIDGIARGVFKSTNGGSSWSAINNGLTDAPYVFSLAIDPTNSQNVYAGTDGGVFKSTTGGTSWSLVNSSLTAVSATSLAIDPTNSQNVYAGAAAGVFKSTNGGTSWSSVNNGLTDSNGNTLRVTSLAIDPTNSQNVYAGANGSYGIAAGVFKSTNGGTSWSAVNNGLIDSNSKVLHVTSLAIDPTNSQNVYAGMNGGDGTTRGVFKSTNGGSSWSAVNNGLTEINNYLISTYIVIDPTNSQNIYAGTDEGVYKSTNGGNSWSAVNYGLTAAPVTFLAIDPTNSQNVYTGSIGVFKSTNGGSSWSAVNNGLTDSNGNTLYVFSLAIDPTNTQNVYAGAGGSDGITKGVFKSTNGGSSWSAVINGLTYSDGNTVNVFSLAIDPTNSQNVYAGTDGGLFKSTTGGSSWSAVNNRLTDSNGNTLKVFSLAIDPTNSQNVYARATNGEGTVAGVFKSTNGGSSWSAVNNGLTDSNGFVLSVTSLAIDPAHSQNVYAGVSSDDGTVAGVFKSTTRGSSWSAVNNGLTDSNGNALFVTSLVIDPTNSQNVYAGVNSGDGTVAGVFTSNNGGISWSAVNNVLTDSNGNALFVTFLAIDSANSQNVYVGTYEGVYKTQFGSATTVPGAPVIGTATAGNAQVTVSFTAPVSNGGSDITGYTVTSIPAGGLDRNAGSTKLSHLMTGLTNGTAYTFTVTAKNTKGTGAASAASNSVTPAKVPGTPTGVTATAGNAQATASFTAPVSTGGSDITGYTVSSIPAGGVDSNAGTTATTHTITGLTNGKAYKFTVKATNFMGSSAASGASNSVSPNIVPDVPTGVTATAANAQATVSFVAPASNGGSVITGYTVTSIPAGGVDRNAGSTKLSHLMTGLTNGTAYTFTVTAKNTKGTGVASAVSNSVTPAKVPGAPTGVTATAGNAQATVSFTVPVSNGGSDITGYTVSSIPAGGVDSNAGTTATTHTITGLTNSKAYKFTVKAINAMGSSAASAASNRVNPNAL